MKRFRFTRRKKIVVLGVTFLVAATLSLILAGHGWYGSLGWGSGYYSHHDPYPLCYYSYHSTHPSSHYGYDGYYAGYYDYGYYSGYHGYGYYDPYYDWYSYDFSYNCQYGH